MVKKDNTYCLCEGSARPDWVDTPVKALMRGRGDRFGIRVGGVPTWLPARHVLAGLLARIGWPSAVPIPLDRLCQVAIRELWQSWREEATRMRARGREPEAPDPTIALNEWLSQALDEEFQAIRSTNAPL